MYFLITSREKKHPTTLLKSSQPIDTIEYFYEHFYGEEYAIVESSLPSWFLDTLYFGDKNVMTVDRYELEYKFASWIYRNSVAWSGRKIRSVVFWTQIYTSLLKGTFLDFLDGFKMRSHSRMAHRYDDYDEDYGADRQEEEGSLANDEEDDDSESGSDENEDVHDELGEIQPNPKSAVVDNFAQTEGDSVVKLEKEQILQPPPNPPPKDSLENVFPYNTDMSFYHPDIPTAEYIKRHLEPLPTYDTQTRNVSPYNSALSYLTGVGYQAFKKRPLQLFPDTYAECQEVYLRPVVAPTDLKSEYKIVVNYLNRDTNRRCVSVFEHGPDFSDLYLLQHLDDIGIYNILLKHLSILPRDDIVESLIEYNDLESKAEDEKEYVLALYKIQKAVSISCLSGIKGVLVKAVMEFMKGLYELDMNNDVKLSDMHASFVWHNNFSRTSIAVLVDSQKLFAILDFLGYIIHDDKVMFLRPKKDGRQFSLDIDYKINHLLGTSYVSQISHQLRREPACNVESFPGAWQMSSKINYQKSEVIIRPNDIIGV